MKSLTPRSPRPNAATPILAMVLSSCAGAGPARESRPARDMEIALETSDEHRDAVTPLLATLVDGGWADGVVAGLVHRRGAEVYGYGRAFEHSDRPPDGDTVFEIGSVTKVFTGLLLAELSRRGVTRLGDPIAPLLPEGTRAPSREGVRISLEHLASHTSGLPRMPGDFAPSDPTNPYVDYDEQRVYRFLSRHSLARVPGAEYRYSNLGVALLGLLLSRCAGSPYEDLVRDLVCRPLGMRDTSVELGKDAAGRFAQGHDRYGRRVPYWQLGAFVAAGGLRSTAGDLLRFAAANAGLVESSLTPVISVSHWERARKPAGGHIALGWHRRRDGVLWHNGQTSGFHSYLAVDDERGFGVVVLANTSTGAVDELGRTLVAMMKGKEREMRLADPPVQLDSQSDTTDR